jgi:hypothetical protein
MHHLVSHCILPVWPISPVVCLQLLKAQYSSKVEYYFKTQYHRNYMPTLNREFVFLFYLPSSAWPLTCNPLNSKFIIMSMILCYYGLILILWSKVTLFGLYIRIHFIFFCEVIKFRAYCKPVFWMIKRVSFSFSLWFLLSFPCECIFANHQILATKTTDNFSALFYSRGKNKSSSYGGNCLQNICDVRENIRCCLCHFFKQLWISRECRLFK